MCPRRIVLTLAMLLGGAGATFLGGMDASGSRNAGQGGSGIMIDWHQEISGTWGIAQGRNLGGTRFDGSWSLRQQGKGVFGRASWYNHPGGAITGGIQGDVVTITIVYSSSSLGIYTGRIQADGSRIIGTTVHLRQGVPIDTASWQGMRIN